MKARRIASQALLVAGSAVGAGLLALPAVTCKAGVVPSCVALLLVWMYMFCCSLLIIETASGMNPKRSAHLLSMATATLGPKFGRRICLALYTVIYSATITAYVAEGGRQAVELLYCLIVGNADNNENTETVISGHDIALGQIIFAGTFARVIYRGPGEVERLNSIFMVGVLASFIILVHSAASADKVKVPPFGDETDAILNATDESAAQGEAEEERINRLLQQEQDSAIMHIHSGWTALPRALPVIVVAFSYHNMISSVYSTLGRDTSESSLSILLGSGISCAMYIVWLNVALGQFENPTDENGVAISTEPLTQEVIFLELKKSAGIALPLFSLLALVTSVLGVGLGCVDFMEEAIDHSKERILITKSKTRRVQATALTFGPALLVAIIFPEAFVTLLEFSGIFRLLLFATMPVAMVWKVRSRGGRADKSVELTKLEDYEEEEEFVDEREGAGLVDNLRLRVSHSQMLPGGKVGLLGVLAPTVIIFVLQINQIIQSQ